MELDNTQRLDELIDELNQLIGLDGVKSNVNDMINLIKISKLRAQKGLPETPVCYHMVFTGNPGTGKTTVARLLSEIYKELGLVSKGHLVETDRAGLVAGFVGQTALKVTEVVEKAKGGVLFIDEAYSLSRSHDTADFGKEAIDTLVKLMEDYRDDLIVIVAGYRDEMKAFIEANSGLASRFNMYIDFPDYTADELMKIYNLMASKAGFLTSEAALKQIENYIENNMKDVKAFGNARGVRNYFEKIIINQANRLVKIENPDKFTLMTIEKEDCL